VNAALEDNVLKEKKTTAAVHVASRITGTGMNVPGRVVGNDHFAGYLETSDEWIRDRTGIENRRWVEENVGASELAEPAARAAMKEAGLTADDIDGIIFATVTPDFVFPSSACCLQRRLGVKQGFAFDVNAVCSGFIYALATADAMIARGLGKNVLVVGADIFSKLINPNDRTTCILFGDGAGAVVLSRVENSGSGSEKAGSEKAGSKKTDSSSSQSVDRALNPIRGIYRSKLAADGNYGDILCVPAGTAKTPTPDSLQRGEHFLTMAGKEVFKLAVRYLGEISEHVLKDTGFSAEDVDFFVSHQANKRILLAMARHLGVPEEKVLVNVEQYGNTSAASVPILLAEATAKGTIKAGDLLLLSAFGGGVTWGAVLLRM